MDAVPQTITRQGEPRWPALKIGPDWLVLVVVILLITPGAFLRRQGRYLPAQIF